MRVMTDFEQQLLDYQLTTAEIPYHLPDHPGVLQSYVWQGLDKVPDFPVLKRFLTFWQGTLDGKLHSVTVASVATVRPAELRVPGLVGHLP